MNPKNQVRHCLFVLKGLFLLCVLAIQSCDVTDPVPIAPPPPPPPSNVEGLFLSTADCDNTTYEISIEKATHTEVHIYMPVNAADQVITANLFNQQFVIPRQHLTSELQVTGRGHVWEGNLVLFLEYREGQMRPQSCNFTGKKVG